MRDAIGRHCREGVLPLHELTSGGEVIDVNAERDRCCSLVRD